MSWRDIIKAFPEVVHDKEGEAFRFVGRQGNLGKYSNGEKEVLLDEKNAKTLAPSKGFSVKDNTKVISNDDEAGTSFVESVEAMAVAVTTADSPALFGTTYSQRKKEKEDEE
jgi:hypothetical protein